ncbi:MAG: pyruvate formate-lyase-activating protein [Anaerorhabdus sp.]
MIGKVASFHSFSTHDGPGIRATIFLQGCPLRCLCCHNPETWDANSGNSMSVDEVISKVKKGLNYYRNGGVTCSGGEPLMQAKFTEAIFKEAKKLNLHTTLDTSGCYLNDDVIRVIEVSDLVMLDIKKVTEQQYYDFAKGSLKQTLKFLDQLEKMQKRVWIRHVVIPTQTNKEDICKLKKILAAYTCVEKVDFLPFKKLCTSKYEERNMVFPLNDIDEMSQDELKKIKKWYEDCIV